MTTGDFAIEADDLGKMYRIYEKPSDRLKQMLWGRRKAGGYGREFWALRGFSCALRRGEMLGVIGANGSGKSTLLQLLAGTVAPTTGSVRLRGRVSALLELGSGFSPEFSGRENVHLAGAVMGISPAEMRERFDAIVAFADIGEFLDQPVKTYSSGMAVRLAFAVASSIEPDTLIVDEALAVGDMVFQQRCFNRFREIRARGASVVFVSHDLGSIIQYCTRAILLDRGQVLGQGSPREMADLYKQCMAERAAPRGEPPPAISAAAPPVTEMKADFPRNPNCQEYGDGDAVIVDWGLLDERGAPLRTNLSGAPLRVVLKIRFARPCADPIAALTVRDLKGNDLCGSNTWFEGTPIGPVRAGETVTVEFRLALPLQSGGSSLCVACTEYVGGELVVHHRLYDILLLETAAERRFVGVFDARPHIQVRRHA